MSQSQSRAGGSLIRARHLPQNAGPRTWLHGPRLGVACGQRAGIHMRNLLWAAVAAAIWLLCFDGQYRPAPLGLEARATEFSAARADAVLARLLGPEKPHPVGSAEALAVRMRLLAELKTLGVNATTLHRMGCFGEARFSTVECATITDVIAE